MIISDNGRCLVNKRELAAILAVSERTLTEWQTQDLPIELVGGRGLDNTYDTGKVIEWRIQRALAGQAKETGKERLERLQAEELELKIEERVGRLVAVGDTEPLWTEAITAARGELLTLPERLKVKLDATYRINVDPAEIEAEILPALTRLAAKAGEFVANPSEETA